MRSFNGYDEFYFDGPGFGNPLIKELTITAIVPGGTQDASCFAGPPESTTPCQTKTFTKGGQMSLLERASASPSRSRRVWWRTTSLI
jgi:hypothetical protein